MAANAASIAVCRLTFVLAPATPISTTVPSSGRARRTSPAWASTACGGTQLAIGNGDSIGGQQAPDAVGDMLAGERGAADILNVLTNLDRVAVVTPDKLRAPTRVAHFAPVGLAIFENLDLP